MDTNTEQNKKSGSILNYTDTVTCNKTETMNTQSDSEPETKEMNTEKLTTETDSKTHTEKDTPTKQNSEKLESIEHNDTDTAISNKSELKSEMNTCDGKSETKDNETETKLPYSEETANRKHENVFPCELYCCIVVLHPR